MKDIKNVAVIGAGTMGHGIAITYAIAGYKTALIDIYEESLIEAVKMVDQNICTLVKNDFITEEQGNIARDNIRYSNCYEDASDADLIVEAVPEKADIKADCYKKLNAICKEDTIFSSTTSAMNIYAVVSTVVKNPERIIITHFNNPSHIIPLVEIVVGPNTPKDLVDGMRELMNKIGKIPVVLNEYVPGFIVSRLNAALLREASYMVEQGWVTAEDVDTAFSANQGLKAPFEGPLELMDYIGWDTAYGVGQIIYPFLNSNTEPARLASKMIQEGKLGIKSGKGLVDYTNKDRAQVEAVRNESVLKIIKVANEIKNKKHNL